MHHARVPGHLVDRGGEVGVEPHRQPAVHRGQRHAGPPGHHIISSRCHHDDDDDDNDDNDDGGGSHLNTG